MWWDFFPNALFLDLGARIWVGLWNFIQLCTYSLGVCPCIYYTFKRRGNYFKQVNRDKNFKSLLPLWWRYSKMFRFSWDILRYHLMKAVLNPSRRGNFRSLSSNHSWGPALHPFLEKPVAGCHNLKPLKLILPKESESWRKMKLRRKSIEIKL